MGKVAQTVKSKLGVLFGCDKCKFKVADRRSKKGPLGLFEVQTTDKVVHGVGYVVTLGVGGFINKPVKKVHLEGVDDDTLTMLRSMCTEGMTFDEIMEFLNENGYIDSNTTAENHYGWTWLTIAMKKQEPSFAFANPEYVCENGVCRRLVNDST